MQFDDTSLGILARKRARIETLGFGRAALNELPRLVRWIRSVPMLRAYLDQILQMHDDESKQLALDVERSFQTFETLARELRSVYPACASDDGWIVDWQRWSSFDTTIQSLKDLPATPDQRRAASAELATTLRARVQQAGNDARAARLDAEVLDVSDRTYAAVNAHLFRLAEASVVSITSPRTALIEVVNMCRGLNAPVEGVPHWTDFVPPDPIAGYRAKVLADAPDANTSTTLQALDRLIDELETLGASTLSYRTVVARFKDRCVWHDKANMRRVAGAGAGTEDRLTAELAKYLHDAGVFVLARPRVSNLEPDLIGLEGLAVEAKAYRTSGNARRDIIKGYYQLHAYMTALEAGAIPAREGFLVTFRLDGPLYTTPPTVDTGRFLIHSLTVDLGVAKKSSGRHQPATKRIDEAEIFAVLNEKPVRKKKQSKTWDI